MLDSQNEQKKKVHQQLKSWDLTWKLEISTESERVPGNSLTGPSPGMPDKVNITSEGNPSSSPTWSVSKEVIWNVSGSLLKKMNS